MHFASGFVVFPGQGNVIGCGCKGTLLVYLLQHAQPPRQPRKREKALEHGRQLAAFQQTQPLKRASKESSAADVALAISSASLFGL